MKKFRLRSSDNSSSSGSSSECEVDLSEEEAEEAWARSPLMVNITRTQSLILDHKQFKAARFIQKHVRGWLVRVRQRNADLAVVVIQKWWRRYQAQRNMVLVAENNLQEAVVAHYHRCATLIQKVFRGWWSRKHIFDLTKLKTLQHLLAEDILHCLGSYLRESKHKSLLPGVHNVRLPRKCLDVTEQLMTTFGYRFYNGQACYKMQKTTAMIEDLRKAFKNSIEYTYVPFHGFNDRRVCERRNSVMDLVEKNPESFDLIQAFVAGQRSMDSKANYKRLLALAHLAEDARQRETQAHTRKKGFFKRIAHDMKKWHADGERILPRIIFNKKLDEMKSILNEVKASLEDEFGRLEPCICGTLDVPSEFGDN